MVISLAKPGEILVVNLSLVSMVGWTMLAHLTTLHLSSMRFVDWHRVVLINPTAVSCIRAII